jgi:hypothetical protein
MNIENPGECANTPGAVDDLVKAGRREKHSCTHVPRMRRVL